ncbi:hypothetical protein ACWOB3_07710 [Enterococcus songbeiensis]
MDEANILAATYLDTCQIMRMQDVEDLETGLTKQDYAPTTEKPISCALSQGNMDGLAVIENGDMLNVATDDYKLFVRPTVEILKGDLIRVTQAISHIELDLYANKPFYYPSHCEVGLTGREPNG